MSSTTVSDPPAYGLAAHPATGHVGHHDDDPIARLSHQLERMAKAQAAQAVERARFEGGMKVALGVLSLIGSVLGTGMLWLVTTTLEASREIPRLRDDVASLHAADDRAEADLAGLHEAIDTTRQLQAETAATLRAIDARLARIERHLDETREATTTPAVRGGGR